MNKKRSEEMQCGVFRDFGTLCFPRQIFINFCGAFQTQNWSLPSMHASESCPIILSDSVIEQ